jgi:prepilin-type N-terminal cleavage/methylation domain-containing protein
MARDFDTRALSFSGKHRAFSLAELVISLFIISVLAVTIGLAMYHSQHRASQGRASLVQLRNQNYVLQIMETDLRFAGSITAVSGEQITAVVPGLGPGGLDATITYSWDDDTLELRRQNNTGSNEVIAADISDFEIEADSFTKNSQTYLRGIYVNIQFGTDAANLLRRYIAIINTPVL